MRRALLLGQLRGGLDVLSWLKEVRSSSMKSENFPLKPRSLYCAFFRNTNLSVSAALALFELMFGRLPRLTAIWRLPSMPARFVVTCFTGSTFFLLRFLLCESEE